MSDPRRARARTKVDSARQVAFDALLAVETNDAYLNLTLPGLESAAGLDARDAAFATELAAGTARWTGTYDRILSTRLKDGTSGLQPEVATAMRLGVHQLLAMRVPTHAAVSTSVELVRGSVGERPVRLVNAVLRRITERTWEEWIEHVAPDPQEDAVGWLATRHAHPRWTVEVFREALGPDGDLEGLLAADNDPPTVTLAVRPGLADPADLSGVHPSRWSPYGAVLNSGSPGALPAVQAGRAGVQDEGSQLVTLALTRAQVDGDESRWLDLCAGPGGKAALLTGLAAERGVALIAAERQHHRARLVTDSLRAYASSPVVTADGLHPPFPSGGFDRVLLDAPCSGLGALRRRPESRWRKRPGDLDALLPLQEALLASALDLTRSGGVVAYVTCSPHTRETREVVERVVADRTDVEVKDATALLPEVSDLGEGPYVQLWPHVHGTDAMFCAILRRA